MVQNGVVWYDKLYLYIGMPEFGYDFASARVRGIVSYMFVLHARH